MECDGLCTPRNCIFLKNRLIASGRIIDVGGGQFQSNIEYGFDKFDPAALKEVAIVLEEGARIYGADAWKKKETRHHVNHAIFHLYEWLAGSTDEKHLVNAFCRIMFALGVDLTDESSVTNRSGYRYAIHERGPGESQ